MRKIALLLPPLFALASLPAPADIVHLADGTRIEGTVTDLGDEIRVQRGPAALTIPKRRVLRIEAAPTPEARYAKRAATVREDDAAGRFALAAWCRDEGMPSQARAEYRKVLAIDPDHAGARHALGYERVDGRWMTRTEAQAARGLALYKGRWIPVEERDARLALEEAEKVRRAVHTEIRQLIRRAALSSDAGVRETAREQLATFRAEDRRSPCLKSLEAAEPEVRALATAELRSVADASCVVPLARRYVLDPSPEVRRHASDALVDLKDPGTGAAFLKLLQNGNLAAKRRAADGLAGFPDRSAIPTLIAVLDYATQPPPEVSLTTAGPGSTAPPGPIVIPGGTATRPPPRTHGVRGGSLPRTRAITIPRVVTSVRQERDPAEQKFRDALAAACVDALRACSGGRDFGPSASAWKGWWIREGAKAGEPAR